MECYNDDELQELRESALPSRPASRALIIVPEHALHAEKSRYGAKKPRREAIPEAPTHPREGADRTAACSVRWAVVHHLQSRDRRAVGAPAGGSDRPAARAGVLDRQ